MPGDPIIAKYGLADYYWLLRITQTDFDTLAAKTATSYEQITRLLQEEGECSLVILNKHTDKDRFFTLDKQESATDSHLWVSQDKRGKKPSIYLFIDTDK